MVRILVPTFPGDVHAVEVALVLRELGHDVSLWNGGDFPTLQAGTVTIDAQRTLFDVRGPELAFGSPGFDVVWYRRPTPPSLPGGLHPGDRPVAERECSDFVDGLWRLVAPEAFWVNALEGRARANSKLLQLDAARCAGLSIPRTCASNDPERIRAFLAELGGMGVYKAFYPAQWEDGDRLAVLLTSEVSAAELPPDDVLRLTPGIFQPRLPKRHELRVVVLGERLITARLLSQDHADTRLDWRARSVDLEVLPDRLPAAVERAVHALMERLGIVFGCLDFIVTPEGEHVFLEVNQMGQFLWLEHANPAVRVLGPFCEFLLARGAGARHEACADVRHADWFEPASAFVAEQADLHVPSGQLYVMPDRTDRPPDHGGSVAGSTRQRGES